MKKKIIKAEEKKAFYSLFIETSEETLKYHGIHIPGFLFSFH